MESATAHRREAGGARRPVGSMASMGVPIAVWALAIAAAAVRGQALIDSTGGIGLGTPPIFGQWDVRLGLGLAVPIVAGALLVAIAPRAARTLGWRALCWSFAGMAPAWPVALALAYGSGGLFDPLTTPYEYLAAVPQVGDPGTFLSAFTDRINDYPIHVQGHPPGFVLVLWGLDQIGLGGREIASMLVVLVAASSVPAVLIATRALAGEGHARRAAPYVALAPAALWIATSADAFFMGVGAWAVAATVLAIVAEGRRSQLLAVAGGALFGVCALLSYGLVLLGAVPLAAAIARRRIAPIAIAAIAGAVVIALPLLAGFWWLDGLAATRQEYLAGVADARPYSYFVFANLAALGIALGPAIAPALARLDLRASWAILPLGGLAAIALADLSGMSKAEVERIWLPFMPWILLATASLPRRAAVPLLALQVAAAIVIQATVRFPW